ncbi:trehalose-phosphatase [Pelomonas sp. CA6]|uniref:trehalose-phosphatase n=1 Tax=Pelomonas sp. CA6 TaxID=2907999 RepID=UPI001F4BD7D6|nr:trehalose-phosphatase [Pelomonas sp. CA6]MCH7344751.1 trehalose-phosphatase [Pelomonas sp. CA6]
MPPLPLFTPAGHAALQATLLARPVLGLDFDGTLAPIVADPAQAQISADLGALLRTLADRLPIAVISGRSVADLRGRLPFTPAHLIGNHGAEDAQQGLPAGIVRTLDALRPLLREEAQAWARLGVQLEDKGASIALHYRRSHDPDAARDALLRRLSGAARREDILVQQGKKVINLLPARAPDKAQALRRVVALHDSDAAIYVGDDLNDEPVFEQADPQWLTVCVAPGERATAARFFVATQPDVRVLLERMLVALG